MSKTVAVVLDIAVDEMSLLEHPIDRRHAFINCVMSELRYLIPDVSFTTLYDPVIGDGVRDKMFKDILSRTGYFLSVFRRNEVMSAHALIDFVFFKNMVHVFIHMDTGLSIELSRGTEWPL